MRPWNVICALCLLAPVVMAVLPSTGWIVRGDCATLVGLTHWEPLGIRADDDIPLPAYYDRAPTGLDRESKLTAYGYNVDRPDFTRKFAALDGHWDDADFLASFVLQACEWAPISIDLAKAPRAGYPEKTEQIDPKKRAKPQVWLNVRRVCDRATTLEPDNAFFPALSAAASDYLGDPSAAAASLVIAGRCMVWNDHSQELQGTFRSALLREFGYRGAAASLGGYGFDEVLPLRCLRGIAAGISRLSFDTSGTGSRRAMFHVARLAYAAAASYEGVEQSARLVNRVTWVGAARKMSQAEARRNLLAFLAETAKRIEPLDPKRLEASLREMIAAEDFRSAGHLGPVWEAPALDYSAPTTAGDSWWAAMTEPQGAGQNATQYTLAAFSVAAGLIVCTLAFATLRRVPPRVNISQIFQDSRWAPPLWAFLGYAGFGVAVCALVLGQPFRHLNVWLTTITLVIVGTIWFVSQVSPVTVAQAGAISQRLAYRFLAVTSLVVCAGIVWQLGVDGRWAQTLRHLRTTAEPARKWAHEHPASLTPVEGDVWWTGA